MGGGGWNLTHDLAIDGGTPEISRPYPGGPYIDEAELAAAKRVLDSGVLSGFIGTPGDHHLGGPEVRRLEERWVGLGGYEGAVAVNSATAGLHAGMAGLGLEPGDEVVVPPYTMSATVAAVKMCGADARFADISDELFTLSAATVEPVLTERTKAIIAVHLFGQMAPMGELRDLAAERGLAILEDAAQAPGATQAGAWPGHGTKGAVFSFNQHKAITAGEGGLLVSDDHSVIEMGRLIRNHAESVVHAYPHINPKGLIGWNYRPTELEAAIALAQTEKLETVTVWRVELAERLRARIADIPGLIAPVVGDGNRHVYFTFALRFVGAEWGCSREAVVAALVAEGVPCAAGYVPPLYTLPMFGSQGSADRDPLLFPTCERLSRSELLLLSVCRWPALISDIDAVANAVEKVWAHRDLLGASPAVL